MKVGCMFHWMGAAASSPSEHCRSRGSCPGTRSGVPGLPLPGHSLGSVTPWPRALQLHVWRRKAKGVKGEAGCRGPKQRNMVSTQEKEILPSLSRHLVENQRTEGFKQLLCLWLSELIGTLGGWVGGRRLPCPPLPAFGGTTRCFRESAGTRSSASHQREFPGSRPRSVSAHTLRCP